MSVAVQEVSGNNPYKLNTVDLGVIACLDNTGPAQQGVILDVLEPLIGELGYFKEAHNFANYITLRLGVNGKLQKHGVIVKDTLGAKYGLTEKGAQFLDEHQKEYASLVKNIRQRIKQLGIIKNTDQIVVEDKPTDQVEEADPYTKLGDILRKVRSGKTEEIKGRH